LFASVVVSWLIDIATCRRKNKIIQQELESDLSELKMWVDELFQAMRDTLSSQDKNKGMTFKVIFDEFIYKYKDTLTVNALDDSFVGIYVFINLILSKIDKLTTGEEKEYLVLQFDDISLFLTLSKSIFDFRENIFNNGNYKYNFVFAGIYNFLSTTLQYYDLLEKEYKSSYSDNDGKKITNG